MVAVRATNASALAMAALQRVEGIEEGSRNVSANINQTRDNVREAGLLLDDAQSRCKDILPVFFPTQPILQQLV